MRGFAHQMTPDRPSIKYRNPRPQLDRVCEILLQEHGLISPAAAKLDLSPRNSRLYIKNHARAKAVQHEARERLGDLAEQRLFKLINEGDWRAISFWLLTMCKSRGYALPKGAAANAETSTTNVMIATVTIQPIESGKWLTSAPGVELESVTGGIVDGCQTKKLN